MRYRLLDRVALQWRIIIFFGLLVLYWSPWALLIYGAGYLGNQVQVTSTVALIALYLCFLVHAWFWGRGVHHWPAPWKHYGLVFSDRFFKTGAIALISGCGLVIFLFGLQLGLDWANLHHTPGLLTIVLEGLAVGLGIGFAEELLFRGWLLAELQTELSQNYAILWSGLLFAAAHFIKPLPDIISTSPQFLGLLLLGLILGMGRHLGGHQPGDANLGIPIGLHAGLVWGYYVVDVADLITPKASVPEWVTGIHGNPLSGILGVTILSMVAATAWIKLRSK
ncbi:MAG: type II CAAX endopeptidase family protein [Cyanobacteria bacterium J06642_11]